MPNTSAGKTALPLEQDYSSEVEAEPEDEEKDSPDEDSADETDQPIKETI